MNKKQILIHDILLELIDTVKQIEALPQKRKSVSDSSSPYFELLTELEELKKKLLIHNFYNHGKRTKKM